MFILYNFFMSLILSEEQRKAEKMIEDWFFRSSKQIFVLAGYAGTGKTTLLKEAVCTTLGLVPDENVAFVTPTGKAATVLIGAGIPACTLHRLIYQSVPVEEVVVVNGKKITVEKLTFIRRESIDSSIRLIVLDEASMVPDETIEDLARFGVKLLICGDNAQLPPVEGFNSCLRSPDFTLSTILRQNRGNPIIALSERARAGGYIPFGRYGDRVSVVSHKYFTGERRRNALLNADQIICGTNKTRAAINDEVRALKGLGGLPETGDKLICTLNNWEVFIDEEQKFNLVNGLIGTAYDPFYDEENGIGFMRFKPEFYGKLCPEALPFDAGIFQTGMYRYKRNDYFEKTDENGNATGAFTLNRFEYGYCISCHKAQGSEFGKVLVFDESYAFKEDRDRWLYTAVTRARKKLIIVR